MDVGVLRGRISLAITADDVAKQVISERGEELFDYLVEGRPRGGHLDSGRSEGVATSGDSGSGNGPETITSLMTTGWTRAPAVDDRSGDGVQESRQRLRVRFASAAGIQ